MVMLVWGNAYKVGFGRIDNDHQELVRMINELADAIKVQRGASVLDKLFRDLVDYTVKHFAMEERLMQTYAYPEKSRHTKEHEDLKKSVTDLMNKFKEGKTTASLQTIHFLNDWLAEHILKTDKHLATFLNAKGVN